MANQLFVESVDELQRALDDNAGAKGIFIYFWGTADDSGESWCPDCRQADPVIEAGLANATEGIVFIMVAVGDRGAWKNPENAFRVHPSFKVTGIPTLIRWKTDRRLEPEECKKKELIDEFFKCT